MKIWKIRNKKTGEFSTGSFYPEWHKGGKFWTQLKFIKSHLTQWKTHWERQSYIWGRNDSTVKSSKAFYDNAEIVEYTLAETDTTPVATLIKK